MRASVFTSAANTYKAMSGGWATEADKVTGNAGLSTDERVTKQPVFWRATSSRDYFGSCAAARSRASSAAIPLNATDIAAA